MLLFLFTFSLSDKYMNGFYEEILKENETKKYDIPRQIFFLKYVKNMNDHDLNLSVQVANSTAKSKKFYPEPNKFYQFHGIQVIVKSEKGTIPIHLLLVDEKSCHNHVVAISLMSYIDISNIYINETDQFCYLFYEPNCDYRVSLDCLSDNRDTLCKIHSKDSLMGDSPAVSCLSNSTCESTVEDGFLVTVQGRDHDEEETYIETSTKILAVKGQNSATKCESYAVDYFDMNGIHSVDIPVSFICQPAEESVMIAVVLICVLVILLIGGVLIYYKCRPNREAYESDEGARRRKYLKKQRSHLLQQKQIRKSEVGVDPRKEFNFVN